MAQTVRIESVSQSSQIPVSCHFFPAQFLSWPWRKEQQQILVGRRIFDEYKTVCNEAPDQEENDLLQKLLDHAL